MTQRRLDDLDHDVLEIFASSADPSSRGPTSITVGGFDYSYLESDCPGGKGSKWVKTPELRLTRAAAVLVDPFDSPLAGSNPQAALAKLSPIVTAVRNLGHTAISGMDTTEYALTVTTSGMENLLGGIGSDLSIHFTMNVWLDDHARYRRTRITVHSPDQPTVTITNDYSHYGTPVTVTPPPNDQVITQEQLAQKDPENPFPGVGYDLPCSSGGSNPTDNG
jgi:hypothetical protein